MNEIPQHWKDIIKSKPPAIDDGSFYYTMPEPLGKSTYSFRYLIETINGAHGIPAGIYIETDIPEEEFEADEINLHVLVSNEVCLQLKNRQNQQTIPSNDEKLIDIGNTINVQYENFQTTNGCVIFHLLPVNQRVAAEKFQTVANGEQIGYVMNKRGVPPYTSS